MEQTQTIPEAVPTPSPGTEQASAPLCPGPKTRPKWKKRLAIALVPVALALWVVVRPMLAGPAAAAGLYQAAQVQRRDLTVTVSGSGTVAPIESYQVSALVSGLGDRWSYYMDAEDYITIDSPQPITIRHSSAGNYIRITENGVDLRGNVYVNGNPIS